MNQRPPSNWPSGRAWPICSIAMTAAEIEERYGIHFALELDDLGEVLEAALWDTAAQQILLTWRDHPEFRSTEVEVDSAIERDEGLRALWRELHLDVRNFDWVSTYSRCPETLGDALEPNVGLLPRQVTGLSELTAREIEVLDRAADGQTNRQIGQDLAITASTVATYLQRIYHKLGLSGRRDLRALGHHRPSAA